MNRALVLGAVLFCGSVAQAGTEHGPTHWQFWLEKLPELLLVIFTGTLWLATRDLVKGAESNAERQLRAYVFPKDDSAISVVQGPSTTRPFEVNVAVKNYGQTPAHDVVASAWVGLDEWPLKDTFNFDGPPSAEPVAKALIPPGATSHYHTGSARPLTTEELASVNSGRLRLYIYGNVKYVDAFKKPRVTNFCYASSTEGSKGYKTAIAKSHLHNDAT